MKERTALQNLSQVKVYFTFFGTPNAAVFEALQGLVFGRGKVRTVSPDFNSIGRKALARVRSVQDHPPWLMSLGIPVTPKPFKDRCALCSQVGWPLKHVRLTRNVIHRCWYVLELQRVIVLLRFPDGGPQIVQAHEHHGGRGDVSDQGKR